jgi:UDP-N-acetylmuramoyl-L-alanyl-D-glutamate--2,6-diaminopimelate ligase
MKLIDLIEGIEIVESSADFEMEISSVSYDSRTVQPGSMFVAVKGYESDGYDFIDSAIHSGASCILCEKKPAVDVPYVRTVHMRRALSIVSANWFGNPARQMKLIGVTGTNGKTTTTNLIKKIIESCSDQKVGLIGTNQNMIGETVFAAERTTPESYEIQKLFRQMADEGCAYVVMEVSSHALVLDRVYGVPFELGIFTNLTPDHLDFHHTMEEYGAAKAILFSSCRLGIINLDDSHAQAMANAASCPVYTYSAEKDEADLVAKDIKFRADSVEFIALTIGKLQRIELAIPGMFSVYNALAAIAAALNLGLELPEIAEALKECSGVMGRAEVVPTGRDFTVIIDYAHTPDALENIIRTVREVADGRVVTLFGCGGDRDKTKRPVMGKIAADLSDFVIVTSDNPRTEVPEEIISEILTGMTGTETPYVVIENRREAIGWAIGHAQENDVIILAGKGHETYQIFGKEKIHFDEREVVADFLASLEKRKTDRPES